MEACPLCLGTKKICIAQVGTRTIIEEDCPECVPEPVLVEVRS